MCYPYCHSATLRLTSPTEYNGGGSAGIPADDFAVVEAYAKHSGFLERCSEDNTVASALEDPGITYRVEWETEEVSLPAAGHSTAREPQTPRTLSCLGTCQGAFEYVRMPGTTSLVFQQKYKLIYM